MEREIIMKRQDRVVTADGYQLGLARNLHHRPDAEVNVEDQLYPVYLEVENFELGDDFFVPLPYVDGRDPDSGAILINATMKEVLKFTWSRMPEFVALMRGRKEPLPSREEGEEATPDAA